MVRGLGQKLTLRANQSTTIDFTPEKAGDFKITCSMGMYRAATLRVE